MKKKNEHEVPMSWEEQGEDAVLDYLASILVRVFLTEYRKKKVTEKNEDIL